MTREKVYSFLKELNIDYELYEHEAIFTIEDGEKHWAEVEATHCKNLFFRDKRGRQHYLVVLRSDKLLDIKKLNNNLPGENERLSFGSDKRLIKYLQLTPGSVSPFGLVNDVANHVILFLDKDLKEAEKISFHPNINTLSLVLRLKDFEKYLNATGNRYAFIEV